jgi:hypothetical protein
MGIGQHLRSADALQPMRRPLRHHLVAAQVPIAVIVGEGGRSNKR